MAHCLFLYHWFSHWNVRKVLACCTAPSLPCEGEALTDHKLGASLIIGIIWFGRPKTTAGKNRQRWDDHGPFWIRKVKKKPFTGNILSLLIAWQSAADFHLITHLDCFKAHTVSVSLTLSRAPMMTWCVKCWFINLHALRAPVKPSKSAEAKETCNNRQDGQIRCVF